MDVGWGQMVKPFKVNKSLSTLHLELTRSMSTGSENRKIKSLLEKNIILAYGKMPYDPLEFIIGLWYNIFIAQNVHLLFI